VGDIQSSVSGCRQSRCRRQITTRYLPRAKLGLERSPRLQSMAKSSNSDRPDLSNHSSNARQSCPLRTRLGNFGLFHSSHTIMSRCTKTVVVSQAVGVSADVVYAFASRMDNLPLWHPAWPMVSSNVTAMVCRLADGTGQGGDGPREIHSAVLDHDVTLSEWRQRAQRVSGHTLRRRQPVTFVVLRLGGVSQEDFDCGCRACTSRPGRLKQLLEQRSAVTWPCESNGRTRQRPGFASSACSSGKPLSFLSLSRADDSVAVNEGHPGRVPRHDVQQTRSAESRRDKHQGTPSHLLRGRPARFPVAVDRDSMRPNQYGTDDVSGLVARSRATAVSRSCPWEWVRMEGRGELL